MSTTADVVIVGGGIVGVSAAAALGQENLSVVLLERDRLGSAASGRAQGLLVPPEDAELIELFNRSVELHLRLAETAGICELDADPSGLLFVAIDAGRVAELEELTAAYSVAQVFSDWLDREATLAREPMLAGDIRAAVFVPDVRRVSPIGATLALAGIAGERGVEIRQGSAVRRIIIEADRVAGVVTDAGEVISTRAVIDAAGPWANEVANQVGAHVPIHAEVGWIMQTEPTPRRLAISLAEPAWTHTPGAVRDDAPPTVGALAQLGGDESYEPDVCFALNQMTSGSLLIGASRAVALATPAGGRPDDRVALSSIARRAARVLPELAPLSVGRSWTCARPATPDGLPIVDWLPGVDGFFVAAGHGSKGIATGPATGEVAAAVVVGAEPAVDISAFSGTRFDDADG